MNGLRVTLKPTRNAKLTGGRDVPFFATYRAVGWTCPSTCTLLGAGCYAQSGHVAMAQRDRYSDNDGDIYRAAVMALPHGAIVRLHVSGDVMLPVSEHGTMLVDTAYLAAIVDVARARPDITFYGYTHAWRVIDRDAYAWPSNLTLNASCDTPGDVHEATARGWATTTVVASDTPWRRDGNTVVCPNQTVGMSCAECMLCAKPTRKLTVAFKAHGVSKRKVDRNLTAAQ
jgi:hypothetical protein